MTVGSAKFAIKTTFNLEILLYYPLKTRQATRNTDLFDLIAAELFINGSSSLLRSRPKGGHATLLLWRGALRDDSEKTTEVPIPKKLRRCLEIITARKFNPETSPAHTSLRRDNGRIQCLQLFFFSFGHLLNFHFILSKFNCTSILKTANRVCLNLFTRLTCDNFVSGRKKWEKALFQYLKQDNS